MSQGVSRISRVIPLKLNPLEETPMLHIGSKKVLLSVVMSSLMLAACGGDDGKDGTAGTPGANGSSGNGHGNSAAGAAHRGTQFAGEEVIWVYFLASENSSNRKNRLDVKARAPR